ncbi:efflux RND transporter periplasmic adaptor subunit [Pseudoalteromonas luteoviolacea]|uniref:efflux RND transporter periplasmic adaptor subunit n=1 Tax=Pseudoalteromonas luteoviolacea TaxID=43657 RepID=UPI001F366CBE|nr:HlyD family efflux transporter periplasmic adaptor subunit [Pseudoalteromonas luteoviolacea]MCF6443008.1 efflux RND transporter periplasmic adaptor subunit [Pseudoalteromonas luteoviolacea]
MDIKDSLAKNKKQKPHLKKTFLGIAGSLALIALGFADFNRSELDLHNLVLAEVQNGKLSLAVSGYGTLRSKQSRFITASHRSQVEEIFYLPGSRVQSDTIIMRLSNPELLQSLNRTRLALARQKASFEALKLSQHNALLTQQGQLTLLKSELANAQNREEAEAKLIATGIVSTLEHKRSQLEVSQLSERVKLAELQLIQTQALHAQRLQIEQELMREVELSFSAAQQDVNKLHVRAGISGMLQEVNVEQGQSVQMGAPLALVGSESSLLADLQVPEKQASRVQEGQVGIINTFSAEVEARVKRIDPVVRDGRIAIELELTGTMPDNARPSLSIEGRIITDVKFNALSLQRPSYIAEQSNASLFVLDLNRNQLVKTPIEFGTLVGNAIEIRSGVKAGEQVVISDMSDFKHLAHITITQ